MPLHPSLVLRMSDLVAQPGHSDVNFRDDLGSADDSLDQRLTRELDYERWRGVSPTSIAVECLTMSCNPRQWSMQSLEEASASVSVESQSSTASRTRSNPAATATRKEVVGSDVEPSLSPASRRTIGATPSPARFALVSPLRTTSYSRREDVETSKREKDASGNEEEEILEEVMVTGPSPAVLQQQLVEALVAEDQGLVKAAKDQISNCLRQAKQNANDGMWVQQLSHLQEVQQILEMGMRGGPGIDPWQPRRQSHRRRRLPVSELEKERGREGAKEDGSDESSAYARSVSSLEIECAREVLLLRNELMFERYLRQQLLSELAVQYRLPSMRRDDPKESIDARIRNVVGEKDTTRREYQDEESSDTEGGADSFSSRGIGRLRSRYELELEMRDRKEKERETRRAMVNDRVAEVSRQNKKLKEKLAEAGLEVTMIHPCSSFLSLISWFRTYPYLHINFYLLSLLLVGRWMNCAKSLVT